MTIGRISGETWHEESQLKCNRPDQKAAKSMPRPTQTGSSSAAGTSTLEAAANGEYWNTTQMPQTPRRPKSLTSHQAGASQAENLTSRRRKRTQTNRSLGVIAVSPSGVHTTLTQMP